VGRPFNLKGMAANNLSRDKRVAGLHSGSIFALGQLEMLRR